MSSFFQPARIVLPIFLLCGAACPQSSHAFLDNLFNRNKGPANLSSAQQSAQQEAEGASLMQQAAAYEGQGKLSTALRIYKKIVKSYPVTNTAANAQFKVGIIREQMGDTKQAFEAYQSLIDVYKRSDRFTAAVERQFQIAEAARQGTVKTSFLGIPKKFTDESVIKFYEAVVSNAPYSRLAPLAQFRIAEIYSAAQDTEASIAAYRKVVNSYPNSAQASEAQFRTGQLAHDASQISRDREPLVEAQDAMNSYVAANPKGVRATEAKSILSDLKEAEAQRAFNIARFYDRQGNGRAAVIYYNEVLKQPGSTPYAQAQERMAVLARANPDAFKQTPVDREVLAKTGVAAQKNVRGRPDYVGPPAPSLAELQAAMAPPTADGANQVGRIGSRAPVQRLEVLPISEPDLPELRPSSNTELGVSPLMPLPGSTVDGATIQEPLPETLPPPADVPVDAPSTPEAPVTSSTPEAPVTSSTPEAPVTSPASDAPTTTGN